MNKPNFTKIQERLDYSLAGIEWLPSYYTADISELLKYIEELECKVDTTIGATIERNKLELILKVQAEYLDHKNSCAKRFFYFGYNNCSCTCGFDQIEKTIRKIYET